MVKKLIALLFVAGLSASCMFAAKHNEALAYMRQGFDKRIAVLNQRLLQARAAGNSRKADRLERVIKNFEKRRPSK